MLYGEGRFIFTKSLNSATDSVRIPPNLGPQSISMIYEDFASVSFTKLFKNIDVAPHCISRISFSSLSVVFQG